MVTVHKMEERLLVFLIITLYGVPVPFAMADDKDNCQSLYVNVDMMVQMNGVPPGEVNFEEEKTKAFCKNFTSELEKWFPNCTINVTDIKQASGVVSFQMIYQPMNNTDLNNYVTSIKKNENKKKPGEVVDWTRFNYSTEADILMLVEVMVINNKGIQNNIDLTYYNEFYRNIIKRVNKTINDRNSTLKQLLQSTDYSAYTLVMCATVPFTSVTFPADEFRPFRDTISNTINDVFKPLPNELKVTEPENDNVLAYSLKISGLSLYTNACLAEFEATIYNRPFLAAYTNFSSDEYTSLVQMVKGSIDGAYEDKYNMSYLGARVPTVGEYRGGLQLIISIAFSTCIAETELSSTLVSALKRTAVAYSLPGTSLHVFERKSPTDNYKVDWRFKNVSLVKDPETSFIAPSRTYAQGPPAKAQDPKTLLYFVTVPSIVVILIVVLVLMSCTASATSCLCGIFRDNIYSVISKK